MDELQKELILECARGKWQREIAKDLINNLEDGIVNPCSHLVERQGKAMDTITIQCIFYSTELINLNL